MAQSRKEWARRVALAVLFPVATLALVEYGLWVFDVAPPVEKKAPEFGSHDAEQLDAFLKARPGQRLICLGESTTAGAPFEHEMNMCTAMARATGLELVNLAGSAQDSNDVLHHGKVACANESTFVYVYSGHNEFLHLERYRFGPPPGALGALGRFMSRFRFYRLLQGWVAPEAQRASDLGTAALSDDQVFALYEANVRALLEACKDRRLVLSTVTSNPDLAFPSPGRTLRETWRELGRFPTVPMESSCRSCFRAAPQVNAAIRRLAAEYASPNLLLVETEDLGEPGKGFARFYDHVHPKPDVQVELARRTLAAVKSAGWVKHHGTPSTAPLTPERIAQGAEERAMYILQFDPPAALKALESLQPVADQLGFALTKAIAGFVMDDRTLEAQGLAAAKTALDAPGTRQHVEHCLAEKSEHRSCLHWRPGVLMNQTEGEELLTRAKALNEPLLDRMIRALYERDPSP